LQGYEIFIEKDIRSIVLARNFVRLECCLSKFARCVLPTTGSAQTARTG